MMNEQQSSQTPDGEPQTPNGTRFAWSAPGGFFDWIRGVRLRRTDDRWVAGVCGGIAERTGLDPMLVRGIAIVIALLGGPVFLAYAAGWALLPDSEGRIHIEQMLRGVFDPALIAIGVLVVLTFVPFGQGIWWHGAPGWWGMPGWLESILRTSWAIVLVGGIIWLVVALARRTPGGTSGASRTTGSAPAADEPSASSPGGGERDVGVDAGTVDARTTAIAVAPEATGQANGPLPGAGARPATAQQRQDEAAARREQRLREAERRRAEHSARWRDRQPSTGYVAISLGLALLAGALVALSAFTLGWSDSPVVVGLAAALAVLAIATIICGIRGRENGGLGFFSTLAVVALLVVGIVPAGTQVSPFGDTEWTVSQSPADAPEHYAMIAGSPTLDLTSLSSAAGDGEVDLFLGAGVAEVLLPDDVPVRVVVDGFLTGVDSTPDLPGTHGPGALLASTVVENDAAKSAPASETTTVHLRILVGNADIDIKELS